VTQINTLANVSLDHIVHISKLWEMLTSIHIDQNILAMISWKLTNDECYLSRLAYMMQFLGHSNSAMPT
jgi:hypothetical protein